MPTYFMPHIFGGRSPPYSLTLISFRFERVTGDMFMKDEPKSLGNSEIRDALLKMLKEAHIRPLTEFVYRIRKERGLNNEVPFFDPFDGGIRAQCLFLLEAPGPKAVESGFISRNNPDETAANTFKLNKEADIQRSDTIFWNIVPWYIGDGKQIRSANLKDIEEGFRYLDDLINLLPNLKAIALVGRKAQKVKHKIKELYPNFEPFESYHPSPSFINRNKYENTKQILDVLKKISTFLRQTTWKVGDTSQ